MSITKEQLEERKHFLGSSEISALFTDKEGQSFAFGIKMTQAKDPKEVANFGLWFGSMQNEAVKKRVGAVLDFIEQNSPETFEVTMK